MRLFGSLKKKNPTVVPWNSSTMGAGTTGGWGAGRASAVPNLRNRSQCVLLTAITVSREPVHFAPEAIPYSESAAFCASPRRRRTRYDNSQDRVRRSFGFVLFSFFSKIAPHPKLPVRVFSYPTETPFLSLENRTLSE